MNKFKVGKLVKIKGEALNLYLNAPHGRIYRIKEVFPENKTATIEAGIYDHMGKNIEEMYVYTEALISTLNLVD